MSSDAFILQGTIDVDINDAVNSLNRVDRQVDSSGKSMSGVFGKLGRVIVGAFAVDKIVEFGTKCLSAASEVEEMENKFNVVFKNTSKAMDEWADSYADSIGRSKTEIKTAISNQSDLMIGMGMTEEVAGDLSKKYTELAYDLASFNNVQDSTALEAMTKAMFGETEMAKQLGLNLNATTMENSEYVKSLGKKWSAMTQAEKAEAYYQEALKQSVNAIGDAERSSDSYANQIRRTQSKITEFTETLGAYMLPMATNVVTWFGDMVDGAIDFVTKIGDAITSFKEGMKQGEDAVDNLWFVFQDVFGIQLPDSALNMVNTIMTGFQDLWTVVTEIWNTVAVPIFNIIKEMFDSTGITADGVFNFISWIFETTMSYLKTVWENIALPVMHIIVEILGWVKDKFAEYMPLIQQIFGDCINMINQLWQEILQPCFKAIGDFIQNVLAPAFKWAFENVIGPVVDACFRGIGNLWNNSLKPIFDGIIDFIKNVFTGNWRGAWESVVQILGGVWSGIKEVIKAPLNAVIGLINKAISAMNKISVTIPDWVPAVGGKTFGVNLPSINYLENGGILTQPTMLNANTMAGEKNKGRQAQAEAVIPLDRLFKELDRLYGQSKEIVLNIDGRQFMRAVAPYQSELDSYNRRSAKFAY